MKSAKYCTRGMTELIPPQTLTQQIHLWLSEGSIPSHFRGFLEEKNTVIATVNSVIVFFSTIKSYRFILNFSEGNTAICICMKFELSERL